MDTAGSGARNSVDGGQRASKYVLRGPLGPGGVGDNLADLGEDDAPTRLQALLAKWMRMENLVALLGAGCSCDPKIGGKTLWNLEGSVLDVLAASYRDPKQTILRTIVEERQGKRTDLGFEGWLSYLSNALHLLADEHSPISALTWTAGQNLTTAHLARLLRDIERAIFAYCSLALPEPADDVLAHHAFLAKLIARDPSLGRAHVFTTNYDTLIEQALDHLGAQYADGFVGRVEPRFDPACYGLDVYYPGEVSEGRVRRYDRFVHLYKLHGSVHWYMDSQTGHVHAKHPALRAYAAWRKMGSDLSRQAADLAGLFDNENPTPWILPTSRKYTETIDLPFAYLFRAFQQRLQQPQTFLIVIGYGFGDEHVNNIIDDAMLNPSVVLLVVDPMPSQLLMQRVEKYQSLGERAFLLTAREQTRSPSIATFDDFAINVMPHVQWLKEFVELRKLEKTIERGFKTDTDHIR